MMAGDRATVVRGFLIAAVSFVVCTLLYPIVFRCIGSQDVGAVVDAEVSAGSSLEAYFNADWARPSSVRLKPGKRFKYKLLYNRSSSFRPVPLNTLRIDITDSPGAIVKIHALAIFDGDQKTRLTGAQLVSTAGFSGIDDAHVEGSTGVFKSSTNDPFFTVSPSLAVSSDGIAQNLGRYLLENLALVASFLCLGLISILEYGRKELSRSQRLARCLFPWLFLAGLPSLLALVGINSAIAPRFQGVNLAVGNAVYSGHPKNTEYVQLYLYVTISAVFGLVVAFFYRSARRQLTEPSAEMVRREPASKSSLLFLSVLITFIALLCLRDIGGAFQSLRAGATQLDYDSLNIETWNYLFQEGFLPFKDFWYPYGFSSFAMGRTPDAMFAMFVHTVALYGVFAACLFFLLERQWLWVLGALLSVFCFEMSGVFRGLYRYFIALDLVLFLSVVVLRKPSAFFGGMFGFFGAYATIFEPSQSLYAAPALVFLLLYALTISLSNKGFGALCKALSAGILTGGFTLIIFGLYIWQTGQLEGLLVVYSRLGSSAVSSSIAGNMAEWLARPLTLEGAVLVGSLQLLAMGICCSISMSMGRTRDIAVVGLAVGMTTLCIFGKHLVRPHMANQFIGLIFVGGILFLWVLRQGWSRLQALTLSAWVGIILYAVSAEAILAELKRSLMASPRNIRRGIEFLRMPESGEVEAYEYYFSRERLSKVYPIISALSQFRGEIAQERGTMPAFFVLGDEAFLYNVFRQKPPPFISFYNSSDVRDQLDIVRWIEAERPTVVVWNSRLLSFDGVPNVVRVPVLFKHVMANYHKVKEVNGFWFLVRANDAPFEVALWQEKLGQELNLGALPSESSIGQYPLCKLGASDTQCKAVIHISRRAGLYERSAPLSLLVRHGVNEYRVIFNALPEKTDFFVRLDRLWFVDEEPNSISASLANAVPGVDVEIEGRVLPDDLLY